MVQLQGMWVFCMFSEWNPPASSLPGHGGVQGVVASYSVLLITHQRGCRAGGNKGNEVNTWKCFLVFPLGARGLSAAPCPSRPAQGLDDGSRRAKVGEKC